jgi:hypothetical protein
MMLFGEDAPLARIHAFRGIRTSLCSMWLARWVASVFIAVEVCAGTGGVKSVHAA